jgi:integrase
VPPRPDTSLLFPAARGGLLNLYNWRRREWAPAIEAAGIRRPARIYDLRSTFASNALAAGRVRIRARPDHGHEHAHDRTVLGALLDGAGAGIASRLDAFDQGTDHARREGAVNERNTVAGQRRGLAQEHHELE